MVDKKCSDTTHVPKNETMVAMPTTLRSSKSRRQGSFEIDGSIDEVPLKLTPDDRVTKRICIFTGILSYSVVVWVVLYLVLCTYIITILVRRSGKCCSSKVGSSPTSPRERLQTRKGA